MGAKLSLTRPGSHLPLDLIGLRYLPGTKDPPRRNISHLFRRCSHRTRISKHLPAHRCPSADWIRICFSTPCILRAK